MSEARLPIAGPWITDLEISYAADAVANAWYENAGDYLARFETAFAKHVGRRFALALPSCTSGLHLALAAAGVGAGDEVVVPDATWIASSAPISYVGATPIFADVDEATWCLTAQSLEAVLTDRTRAVIAVDLYGGMPELDDIERLCAERGVVLIEDAAEAIGSALNGRAAGSFGAASTFSFHGSKTLTTGEGGMVLTDDEDLYRRMSFLRDHGRRPGDVSFFNDEVAFKYRMSSLQAAVGLAQLERVEELVQRKRDIFGWYRSRLDADPRISLNVEPAGTTNSYWMSTIVLAPSTGITKVDLGVRLAARGIDTRPFFHPLSSLPAYAESPDAARARASNDAAYRVCPHGLNLPSALRLTEADVDRVCRAVVAALDEGPAA